MSTRSSPTRLTEAIRAAVASRRYSSRTADAYVHWIDELCRFHEDRDPSELGAPEITAFLNHLATDRELAPSTQNQALCALAFVYRRVIERPLPQLDGLTRAPRPSPRPAALSRAEVRTVLAALEPPFRLMADLLYGSGLRLVECLSLRVEDIDIERSRIAVRRGNGDHDRHAMLPDAARGALGTQLAHLERRYGKMLAAVRGPDAPRLAGLGSQYLFPSARRGPDPAPGGLALPKMDESGVQTALHDAARVARIDRPVTPSALRHSFAVHLLESGTDVRTLQTLLGHKNARTTRRFLRDGDHRAFGVVSPLDR